MSIERFDDIHPDNFRHWQNWLGHLRKRARPGAAYQDWRLRLSSTQHLLIALGKKPLEQTTVHEIAHLLQQSTGRSKARDGKRLSFERMRKVHDHTREFLGWLLRHDKNAVRRVDPDDLPLLCVKRADYERALTDERQAQLRTQLRAGTISAEQARMLEDEALRDALGERPIYDYDTVLKIASLQAENDMRLWRAQACACLQFASGMRVTATATVSLACLDLAQLQVRQLPALGVRTKGGASGITPMMPDERILAPVRRFHAYLSDRMPADIPFFVMLCRTEPPELLGITNRMVGKTRGQALSDEYENLFQYLNIPYKGTHAFRRGHVVHMTAGCRTMNDFIALSEAMLHSNTRTTQVYASLSVERRRDAYQHMLQRANEANHSQTADGSMQRIQQLLHGNAIDPSQRSALKALVAEIIAAL